MKNKFIELEKVYEKAFENGLINKVYPIGIASGKEIYIYHGSKISQYKTIKKVEMPFEIPPKTQAAFQPPDFDQSIVVLGRDVFSSLEDMITVIHEFVHCYQSETCLEKLRNKLEITKHYKKLEDWMWEINHPFPYENQEISEMFSVYRESLINDKSDSIIKSKFSIKENLLNMDYEYMVWQEWVEGYARYIENELRNIYGLDEVQSPARLVDRRNWYETGSLYFKKYRELDIEQVYEKISVIL